MRNFRELLIWQKGMALVKVVYRLVDEFPPTERYGISSQVSRAVVSIPSNIAEGTSRSSQKEFTRYLEIAIGSAYELETQLSIVQDLGWISESTIQNAIEKVIEIEKMINAFIKNMKS